MTKAALYARVSSDHQQKEGTIKSQVAELRRQISAAGHTLVKEYIDDGYSGGDMDRPALEEMRQDLKTDVFDGIYFLCNDRIAREVVHQLIIVDELRRHGKRIIINGRDYEENPENKLSLTMFGAFAEFERAKILERSKRGKLHRLRSGQVLGQGMSPYGYDYVSRTSTSVATLLVNDREASVVRHIFEAFANGTTICGIARSLERQGIPTRLGKRMWDASHLKTMLHRHTYAGTRYYNTVTTITEPSGNGSKKKRRSYRPKEMSEWIGVKVPPIVSRDLFEKVQEKLRENRQRYVRPPVRHLLGNMLRCGECGGAMFSYNRYYTRMTKEPRLGVYHKAAYCCIRRKRAHAHDSGVIARCRNSEIATHILEGRVLELVRDVLCDPDKLRRCIEVPAGSDRTERKKLRRKLTAMEKRITAVEEERRRLVTLYATGELAKEAYIDACAGLDRELDVLTRHKGALRAIHGLNKRGQIEVCIRQYCERARARFERCTDFDARRHFLINHLERIIYHPRNVVLVGAIPANPGSGEAQHMEGGLRFRIEGPMRRIKTLLGSKNKGYQSGPGARDGHSANQD